MTMLLAGDVGGTKTDLAIISPDRGPNKPLFEATLPSGRYLSLEALVTEFLADVDVQIERASFGVAGPVVDGKARITNLPWTICERKLQETFGLSSVRLLNDLAAIAYAAPLLEPGEVHTLNQGEPVPGGTLAVIAPGTGLGESFLTWDGTRFRPVQPLGSSKTRKSAVLVGAHYRSPCELVEVSGLDAPILEDGWRIDLPGFAT